MATGRTTLKNWRIYIDGYDMSGYTRSFGPLACTWQEGFDDAITNVVKKVTLGNAVVSLGTLTGLYDNTATSGIHAVMNGAGVSRKIMCPVGIQDAPANNDPVFCGQFLQTGYSGGSDNPVVVTIPFNNTYVTSASLVYGQPWGALLLAKAAKTAANTATGLDQTAQTTRGGWMMYQVFAAAGLGNMSATIKVQDADTNSDGSFGDLLSSGSINCINGGVSGSVALATTATVKQYIRWQIALGTATSVTFALAFMRNYV